jgi:hypothetical protein
MPSADVRIGPPALPADAARPAGRLAEFGAAVLPLALAGLLAWFVLRNAEPPDERGDSFMRLALIAFIALPGVLAFVARDRRPALYLAAGMLSTVGAFVSMAGAAIPMLIPAGMAFVAYGRHAGEARGRLADPVVALLVFVLAQASFLGLFLHQDPRCVSGPNYSSCTSDVITSLEATLSFTGFLLTLVAGWLLARPRGSRERV